MNFELLITKFLAIYFWVYMVAIALNILRLITDKEYRDKPAAGMTHSQVIGIVIWIISFSV